MPHEIMRRLMDEGSRILRDPAASGMRTAEREAVNWADLSVVEVHESTVLYRRGAVTTRYAVVIEEASPDAIALCERFADALEKAVPAAGEIEVSSQW